LDVLRHRVSVTYEAEAENVTSEDVIYKILETLPCLNDSCRQTPPSPPKPS